jgi:hypothetical protein
MEFLGEFIAGQVEEVQSTGGTNDHHKQEGACLADDPSYDAVSPPILRETGRAAEASAQRSWRNFVKSALV